MRRACAGGVGASGLVRVHAGVGHGAVGAVGLAPLGAPALPGGLASTEELRGERVSGLVRSGGTSREVGGRQLR